MKEFKLVIFTGSTMLTHKSMTMYGIVNALRDVALGLPEYKSVLNMDTMDEYIADLIQLKNGTPDMVIKNDSPFIRITYEEDMMLCPPALPDCNTEKEVSPWQK